MTALKRSPPRLALAEAIAADQIQYYPWAKKHRAWHTNGDEVTGELGKFLTADPPLATTAAYPDDPFREPWPVYLTTAGRDWLAGPNPEGEP